MDFNSIDWAHILPFGVLAVKNTDNIPPNRPALTRLTEQLLIAVIAGGFSAYVTFNATLTSQTQKLAAQEITISELKQSLSANNVAATAALLQSEARMTAQIAELRQILLKKAP